jgi:PAS domain-containing protein
LDLARIGAAAVDRELAGVTAALRVLATSRSLESGDLADFHRRAVTVGALLDANITLRDRASRQVVNSGVPWGQPLPDHTSLAEVDQEVLRTGLPAVSDHYVGIVNRRPSAAVVVPVVRNGEITHVLSASVQIERIRRALGEGLAPGWRSAVVDRKGILITRTKDPDASGQPAVPSFLEAARSKPTGIWRGLNREGKPGFGAFHRTSAGWIVAPGGSDAELEDRLDRVLAWTLSAALALVALAVGVASTIARGISRPLRELARLGAKLGRGEAVPPMASGNSEANAVARSLAGASARIRAHEAELRSQAAEWRTLLTTLPVAVWFTRGSGGGRVEANAFAADLAPPGFRLLHPNGREAMPTDQPLEAALDGRDLRGEELVLARGDGRSIDLLCNAAPIRDEAGAIAGAVIAAVDITDRKRAEAHRSRLVDELNHRVKNTLATVQSIAAQTLRNAGTPAEAREVLEARLMALSRAHNLLTRESWSSIYLREIVAESIEAHRIDGARFRSEGPQVLLIPSQALALAMGAARVVHERQQVRCPVERHGRRDDPLVGGSGRGIPLAPDVERARRPCGGAAPASGFRLAPDREGLGRRPRRRGPPRFRARGRHLHDRRTLEGRAEGRSVMTHGTA